MPLDPFLAAKTRLLDGASWELGQKDARVMARMTEFFADPDEVPFPAVVVEEQAVPGPHGAIGVRVYRRPGEDEIRRALVWLHGGGFWGGDLEMPEAHLVSAELALRADALVVSVGYRLATDGVRYPVPIDDAYSAWLWLTEGEGARYLPSGGGMPPVALGGASAGAALALSTAIRVRDKGGNAPSALVLAYPFAHFPTPALDARTAAEMQQLPEMLRFSTSGIEDMVRNYVGRLTDLPPDALPGAAPLSELPPTSIVISEYDDLRPSAELLVKQLEECGVPVRTYLAKGMLHGHLNRNTSLAEVGRSLDFFADTLRGAC